MGAGSWLGSDFAGVEGAVEGFMVSVGAVCSVALVSWSI